MHAAFLSFLLLRARYANHHILNHRNGHGWGELGKLININCFKNDPSVKSSLKFLRRTPWARAEVEALYLDSLDDAVPEKQDEPALNPWANSRLNKS